MIFQETNLKGSYIIDIERHEDKRGFFARSFCQKEFKKLGLRTELAQCNISFNLNKATIRGMHFQKSPHEEAKLVSCLKGRVYDVIVDLRPNSETYCQWHSFELDENDYRMIYIPEGFAHGFQTLKNNSAVYYQMFEYFHAESGLGVRWNDPIFNIDWPLEVQNINERDKMYPDFIK